MPSSSTNARGWPAISPHTVSGLFRARHALMTWLSSFRTGGASGWQRWLTFGLSRSAAIKYCTRSFDPTDTKSACRNIASIEIAAAGTSNIMPIGTVAYGFPASCNCVAA